MYYARHGAGVTNKRSRIAANKHFYGFHVYHVCLYQTYRLGARDMRIASININTISQTLINLRRLQEMVTPFIDELATSTVYRNNDGSTQQYVQTRICLTGSVSRSLRLPFRSADDAHLPSSRGLSPQDPNDMVQEPRRASDIWVPP